MIYKNNEIPDAYNRIAEVSDNYIVWVRESKLNSGSVYNAYYQYFEPSFSYFYTGNYRITTGDTYTLDANYITNGMYNYLDSYDVSYSRTTIEVDPDEVTSEEFNRADMPIIFICQVVMCIIFLWVFKQLSRIFYRGGIC